MKADKTVLEGIGNMSFEDMDDDFIIARLHEAGETKNGLIVDKVKLRSKIAGILKAHAGNASRLPEKLWNNVQVLCEQFVDIKLRQMKESGWAARRITAAKAVLIDGGAGKSKSVTFELDNLSPLEKFKICQVELSKISAAKNKILDHQAEFGFLDDKLTKRLDSLDRKETKWTNAFKAAKSDLPPEVLKEISDPGAKQDDSKQAS